VSRAAQAGVAYAAVMFAVGFALGTLRLLVLAPRAGTLAATLLELPVMLALSWVVCARLVRRLGVPAAIGPRLVMGAVALGVLLAAETVLGVTLLGRTLAGQLQSYAEPAAALGLVAQLAFALFPLVQLRSVSR
jgi:hypothetical protein